MPRFFRMSFACAALAAAKRRIKKLERQVLRLSKAVGHQVHLPPRGVPCQISSYDCIYHCIFYATALYLVCVMLSCVTMLSQTCCIIRHCISGSIVCPPNFCMTSTHKPAANFTSGSLHEGRTWCILLPHPGPKLLHFASPSHSC